MSGSGGNNTFVAKLAALDGSLVGTPIWFNAINASSPIVAVAPNGAAFGAGTFNGPFVLGGGLYCATPTSNQGYLVEISPAFVPGTQPSCYSGADPVVTYGLAVDAANDVVLGLSSSGVITSPSFTGAIGPGALVTAKLAAPYGNYLWAHGVGLNTAGNGSGVAIDGMGYVVMTGNPGVALDLGEATVPAGQAFVYETTP